MPVSEPEADEDGGEEGGLTPYLQPGERLVCQGCHEPKKRPPVEALAVGCSLPDWFAERLLEAFDEKRAWEIGKAFGMECAAWSQNLTREKAEAEAKAEGRERQVPLPIQIVRVVLMD